jgi:alcohol dehydrogenase (cytochrome c)/quinohemoprotein ethanol dehydrogenase
VYDPELDLLYIGVSNGGPWNQRIRSPRGGDNLFIASIVALKPDTGEYVWHYQETPGDMWDYTSTQQIIFADISIDGQVRKVLLHAPKNGFFYVLDRVTGALISAKPYTQINWATGVDMKTGRPIETPIARYPGSHPAPILPGPSGAHSWHSMSYSPLTGLVYIPVQEGGFLYKSDPHFQSKKLAPNYGVDVVAAGLPQDPNVKKAILDSIKGRLLAWDPVHQKEAWGVARPGFWNGGILSTAGNLVFQGTAEGNFEAYRADTGEKVWSFSTQSGVIAAPVSYTVNGEQYVAILAGWGGVFPLVTGEIALKSTQLPNFGRMLAFKLGGKASLPPRPEVLQTALDPPPSKAPPATVAKGEQLYQRYCAACHGDVAVGGGLLPDLRYSGSLSSELWFNVVLDGLLQPNGMVSFDKELSRQDAAAIRAYVILRANQALAEKKSAGERKRSR